MVSRINSKRPRHVDLRPWGANPPYWIDLLAHAVQATSRQHVAEELGYSRTAISLALANKYRGARGHLAEAVLRKYDTVTCPLLGNISSDVCQRTRNLPFVSTNHRRIQQYRACRVCPNNPNAKVTCHELNAIG